MEKQTLDWQETRRQGKLTRKSETEVIRQLIEYAREQGSQNPDKLYMVYSKLANKVAGIEDRDRSNVMQLNNLSIIENIILQCIDVYKRQAWFLLSNRLKGRAASTRENVFIDYLNNLF